MDWLIEKLERLLAAVWVAAFGIVASQISPLATQYMARTAADLARAEAHLSDVQSGLRYQTMADTVRSELATLATQSRNDALNKHKALADVSPLIYPWSLWRATDPTVMHATWNAFMPTLPTKTWAITLTTLGALIGFALYELIKWPIVMLLQAPRRRFKKRGGLI